MSKYGFVYIWYDRKHKRYYIGSHWGSEDDGYICSSSWMRQAYKHRPGDFTRKILAKTNDRGVLLDEEFKWLSMIGDEEIGTKYYNLNKRYHAHWSADPDKNLTTREKLSKANKGKPNPKNSERLKGRTLSEEHKAKLRGRTPTAETRAKLSAAGKGQTFSDERKAKIGAAVRKTYRFIDSSDQLHVVDNLEDFCVEHGLKYHPMVNLFNGKYYKDTYKGWKSGKFVNSGLTVADSSNNDWSIN